MDEEQVTEVTARKSNVILGGLLIMLCLCVWYETASYPDTLLDARKLTGPGTFPRLLSMFLGLIGAWEIIRAFRMSSWKISFPGKEAIFSSGSMNIWIVIIMTALFIPLTQYLGFSIGSMIYMYVLMARLKAKPWLAILSSLLTVVFIVAVFNYVFRVQLPVGILTEPFGWRY
jgi:hypothetical protein